MKHRKCWHTTNKARLLPHIVWMELTWSHANNRNVSFGSYFLSLKRMSFISNSTEDFVNRKCLVTKYNSLFLYKDSISFWKLSWFAFASLPLPVPLLVWTQYHANPCPRIFTRHSCVKPAHSRLLFRPLIGYICKTTSHTFKIQDAYYISL
jgi:hypothetical protein